MDNSFKNELKEYETEIRTKINNYLLNKLKGVMLLEQYSKGKLKDVVVSTVSNNFTYSLGESDQKALLVKTLTEDIQYIKKEMLAWEDRLKDLKEVLELVGQVKNKIEQTTKLQDNVKTWLK